MNYLTSCDIRKEVLDGIRLYKEGARGIALARFENALDAMPCLKGMYDDSEFLVILSHLRCCFDILYATEAREASRIKLSDDASADFTFLGHGAATDKYREKMRHVDEKISKLCVPPPQNKYVM